MSKVLTDSQNYTDIANAIRAKGVTGTFKPSEMASAIESIASGGGELPDEAFNLTGDIRYTFASNSHNWFLNSYASKIKLSSVTNSGYLFHLNTGIEDLSSLKLDYGSSSSSCDVSYMFYSCNKLKQLPKITNVKAQTTTSMFNGCYRLREIPEDYFDTWNMTYINKNAGACQQMFCNCYSLRSIPLHKMQGFYSSTMTVSYGFYYSAFNYCYVLDEVACLPVANAKTITSNMFSLTFGYCWRLKKFTFATNEDGTPKVASWKSQVIDLSSNIGFAKSSEISKIVNYNSGITSDKYVTDAASYDALKNDPDYYTSIYKYARYNHDSAVETINSLPDTSAYLATTTGTNTIKFYTYNGSSTDGGGINTLTDTEIAVASAKGWTVTIV